MLFRPTLKSLKAFAAAAFASAAIFAGETQAQFIDYNSLNQSTARLENGLHVGDQPGVRDGYYRVGGFAGLFEDSSSLLFVDGHGNVNFDSGNWSGDFGVGYRKDVGAMVLGGNAYYNYREYSNGFADHNFSTIGFGAEALMSDWAVRSNAFFAIDDRQSNGRTPNFLVPSLVQQAGADTGVQNILLANQTENFDEALDGFDLNISHKVPSVRSEFGAGVYYLSAGGGPDTWGVNGTLESWFTSNVAGNINVSHDDFFDTTVYGGVSIYFGGPAIDANTRTESVVSRLWSRVQRRHVVPVLNYTTDAPDLFATNPGSGDLITVVQIAQGGDLLNAPNRLEADGDFVDIILVDADAVFNPMGTIALNDNQRLLSADRTHFVTTAQVGTIILPESGQGGGSASIVAGGAFDTVTIGNNGEVNGFNLSAMPGNLALSGFGVTDVLIANNTVTGPGGILIDAGLRPSITASFVNNSVMNGAGTGIEVLGADVELFLFDNVISGNNLNNVNIFASGQVSGLIANNMFNDSVNGSGLFIQAGTISAGLVSNIANNNFGDGLVVVADAVATGQVLDIIGNTANLNGNDGIAVIFNGDADSTVEIRMNTADGNGGDGISLESFGMGDILGLIADNTTNGNDPGIFVESNDVNSDLFLDIIGNVSGGNANQGIQILAANNFTGRIERNTAGLNGDDGLQLFADGDIDLDLVNNTFVSNMSDGAEFDAQNYTGLISGNMASNNEEAGLYFFSNGDISLDVLGNITNNNLNTGAFEDAGITLLADGSISGLIDGNTANGNGQWGLFIGADDDTNNAGEVSAVVRNNTAGGNSQDGIHVQGVNVTGELSGNTADGNGGAGIFVAAVNDALLGTVSGNMSGVNAGNMNDGLAITAGNNIMANLTQNIASNNGGNGIFVDAGNDFNGTVGDLMNVMLGNVANANANDGFLFFVGNNYTGDFVNNSAIGNGGFDYNTTAGGVVTGTVSPNTSTTNNAGEFNGNIATP